MTFTTLISTDVLAASTADRIGLMSSCVLARLYRSKTDRQAFRRTSAAAGIRIVHTPYHAPNANA